MVLITMVQSCSKSIPNVMPLILPTTLWRSCCYYPWFADEETDPEEGAMCPRLHSWWVVKPELLGSTASKWDLGCCFWISCIHWLRASCVMGEDLVLLNHSPPTQFLSRSCWPSPPSCSGCSRSACAQVGRWVAGCQCGDVACLVLAEPQDDGYW